MKVLNITFECILSYFWINFQLLESYFLSWKNDFFLFIVSKSIKFNQAEILHYLVSYWIIFCCITDMQCSKDFKKATIKKGKNIQKFYPEQRKNRKSSTWLWLLFVRYICICLQSYKTNNQSGVSIRIRIKLLKQNTTIKLVR